MRYYTVILCLFLSSHSIAQLDVTASTFTGFETNINQVPDQLELNGDFFEQEDLYMNSAYQDLVVRFKYKYNWKNNSLTFYLTPDIRYYFSEAESSQTILNTRISHKYMIRKNFNWENSIQYKIKDREGQDLDQVEIGIPFGYKQFKASTGLRFRMSKSNRSLVRVNYMSKDFDNSNSRSVMYSLYGIDAEFKQIKWRNHLLHSYGVKLGYDHRDYAITNFSNNSNDDRTWTYFNASIFYRLPFSKKFYIQPELAYLNRNDQTNNRFSYSQIRPELNLVYKTARFEAKVTTSYTGRTFSTLIADNIEGDPVGQLEYKYFRLRANMGYNLNNKWSLLLEGSIIDRNSNQTDITTSAFRSYLTQYAGIGFRFNF